MKFAACLAALGLALAAPAALAGACTSANNEQYPSGRKPVLSIADMNQKTVSICYQDYNLYASKVTGTNLWSAQHLTRAKVIGAESITRIDSTFFSESGFPTTHKSYTNSGYDRGHMMPAGDASTTPAQKETFSVANIVPQTPKLNRGTWAQIESIVRTVAKEWDEAYIVTGPDFDNMDTTIASGAVVVPTQTWKAVYVPSAQIAGAYWCVNSAAPTCSIISLNELKRRAFVDPFPSLGTALRAQTASDWTDVLVLP
ncbi:DNA/RNA non-specific endonuclease [Lysobacter sp. K5869]|uniref:DNA/RNA non-specific endonuclease n=1 Tax=Lysobacter sp. K5869 TaxID=2820808 RepID=UPI001C062F91|nr:DNA/RNA non-specific endonuclease [Lysobacter sp. K5869]QWP75431.1 DNA/RNA non-specific endonuclease [Lysobacter sp. K5869]